MNTKTKHGKACVIGWPVAQSLSPLIHEHWMQKHGIEGSYEAIAIDHGDLEKFLGGLRCDGMVGANVTIPHKQAVLNLVDDLSPTARSIGAVNTITVAPDRRLHGLNTDGAGFINWLAEAAPGWRAGRAPALVLGAGGAARAIVAALLAAGVTELRLANRSTTNAEALKDSVGGAAIAVVPWDDRAAGARGAGLLVNTTPLGMTAMPPLEIDLSGLAQGAVVYDIVYAPLETELLSSARAGGFTVVDGLGMLCHQAALSFESWFGILPAVDNKLRAKLEQAINSSAKELG